MPTESVDDVLLLIVRSKVATLVQPATSVVIHVAVLLELVYVFPSSQV